MSQPIAYTPPDYVPPDVSQNEWPGEERRSRDPINQLGRSLNRLCLEATDPYEIVAHLEALGFHTPAVLARFGVSSHFELAHALYQRTPRIRNRGTVTKRAKNDWATPVAMALAFVTTYLMGAFNQATMLIPAIVVLVWSQVGAAIISKAQGELSPIEQRRVSALMVQLGAAAVAASWFVLHFGLSTLAPTLVWFAVGSLIWSERWLHAMLMPVVVGVSLAATALFSLPSDTPLVVVVLITGALCVPLVWRNTRGVMGWLTRSAGVALHPLLYGLGQGLLIWALLRDGVTARNAVPGAVLLLLILLLSHRLLVSLKTQLAKRLWDTRDQPRFKRFSHVALASYVGVYALPLVAAVIVQAVMGEGTWHFHWYAFGLFGLNLGISVVGFALGDPAGASVPFVLAGLAAALGVPFLWVSAGLALVLLVVAQLRVRQVGRYAIYLL